jgi:hypothetical protein
MESGNPTGEARPPAKKRLGLKVLIGVIALAIVATGVVAAKKIKEGPSPDTVLSDARSYTNTHRSVRFAGTFKLRLKEDKGSLGSSNSVTSRIEGQLESKGRSRAVIDSGSEGAVESIALGRVVYVRQADSKAALDDAKFEKIDTDASPRGVVRTEAEDAKELDIAELLAVAENPRKVSHSGAVTTITANVPPRALLGAVAAQDVSRITLELVVRKNGQVQSLVQRSVGSGATVTVAVRYTNWGRPVKLAAPAAAQIDPTPGLEEEKIAAWKDAPLLMPKGIPVGWVFDGADVLSKDDTTEGCAEVELDYEDPNDPDAGYLSLYEFPASCAQPFSGAGVTPFSAGPYSGFADTSDGVLVQFVVGKTAIQAESDLTVAQLATVLKNLVPFSFKTKLEAIPGIAGGPNTSA